MNHIEINNAVNDNLKNDLPRIKYGDTVNVSTKLVDENGKTRFQNFKGLVIKLHGSGMTKTVSVLKNSFGINVEKTFPLNSPNFTFEILSHGKVRRAKLYYIRDLSGKAARIKKISVNQTKNK